MFPSHLGGANQRLVDVGHRSTHAPLQALLVLALELDPAKIWDLLPVCHHEVPHLLQGHPVRELPRKGRRGSASVVVELDPLLPGVVADPRGLVADLGDREAVDLHAGGLHRRGPLRRRPLAEVSRGRGPFRRCPLLLIPGSLPVRLRP